ncbi:MAG TPA: amino acid adenylation domain-containing protein, partial [Thermoanaerobaculia bacterium]|nr:amino acid adenylation domain-containing protein [Thermoanaerobaculia bacterium]
PWFVSTAHTERDLDELVEAVKASTAAMQAGGFLPCRGEAPERARGAAASVPAARRGAVGEMMASSGRAPLPLTESQKALWIATQMGEDALRAYHISIVLRLAGVLPAAALAAAGQRVVDRHEALRTVFGADGEFQRFQPRIAFPVAEVDLGGLPAARRDRPLAQLVQALTQHLFDLERGPLLRCGLLRLGPAEQVVVLVFHHLVVDGWSLGAVLGELDRSLAAELRGESCELPPVALFGDYVRRQQEPQRRERDEAYWLARFAPPLPVFTPPVDRPRPSIETFAGRRALCAVDADLSLAIRQLGGRRGCTLPATLLALFSALLHRLCGQLDLVVGMPAAGQAEEDGGALVGYCLQILPLRSRLAGPERLSEHVVAARRSLLDAYEHRAYPLTRLIRRLGIPRDPSRTPLVGVLFNVDAAWSMATFGGLGSELLEPPVETAQYELSLNVEDGRELRLGLDYKSDLFDRTTVQRWLSAVVTLCRSAVDNPEETVLALPLLSPAERHQLLAEWNDTAEPARGEPGIPAQVAAQAQRTPEAIAVAQEERQWSYGELDRRAARLARRLLAQGIGAGDLVGLCLERTPELLVALLGVQQAGAAYLPLDPSFPAERLAYMLADSGARWVLTEESLSPCLAGYQGRLLFLAGGAAGEGDGRGEEMPGAGPGPDGRAYVLYTSGSTGRPKGVEVHRRSLLNFLASMARRPGLGPADVLVAVTTLSFDIAALELYLPLLVGGRLELASRETATDGDRLAELLARSGATVAQATPATWRLLLAAGWRNPSRLRVLSGGEALPRDLALSLLALSTPLWNLYGPTETTVWSAVERVGDGGAISLGRPIANTALRLLDRGLLPVPIGVTAELYISGAGVACGYLGQPAGTAERFLPDPLAERPGERLYRTGDLARWRPDGGLEFLGRADQQVKVRGLRIELEEIEAALGEPAWVAAAAVALREPRPGDQRLVGYVVLRADGRAPEDWGEALRTALRRKLPGYMVPTVLVRLPALPLTPNGKVDRRTLPAPEGLESSRASTPAAGADRPAILERPPSGTEQAVAAIWREVLGAAVVGLDDNFFDLGGHSLLLIEVRQRLRPLAGRAIPLLELFRHPTIRSLAAFVAGSGEAGAEAAGEAERGRARQAAQELQRAARQRRRAAKSLGRPGVDLGGADDGTW